MPTSEISLAQRIVQQERRALARAITLAESTRSDHREQTVALLAELRSLTRHQAIRVGLSGTPGVGKSTFTEAFGMMLIEAGLRVAVLAVDPSSSRNGGSILGDKTRMENLSRQTNAFIRPSPSQMTHGGVARRSREAVLLCEAAGYDVVLIETVGVGQSETMVADISDIFLLLLAPVAGDELQGVKRGIMEIADLILVNKADGDLKPAATRTCADYAGALRLMRKRPLAPDGYPKTRLVSALTGEGLEDAWQDIKALIEWRQNQSIWSSRRAEQARLWFDEELKQGVLALLEQDEAIAKLRQNLRERVSQGKESPDQAAAKLLGVLTGNSDD